MGAPMNSKRLMKSGAALAALLCAAAAHAHHSGYMYESTPIWLEGTVVSFEAINPHSITMLQVRGEDGQLRRWAVEGPPRVRLDRDESKVPEVGEVLGFCAFPYKSPEELSAIFPGVDFSARRASAGGDGSSPQYVAGHVMQLPDGEKRIWEPHGVLSECIRSSGAETQPWIDFLNSSSAARQAWCEQRRYAHNESTAELQEFVVEVTGMLDESCP